MLKTRVKRYADQGQRARKRLAEIETSIAVLSDDDLLDLCDIFKDVPQTPLAEIAFTEMAKRGISL
jgi:hypothetical protein